MSSFISFDNELKALNLTEQRASLIARNLANTNTPEYKAQDLNFEEAMQGAAQGPELRVTNANHLEPRDSFESGPSVYYRVPMQTRIDGNTVDDEIERKNFIENSLRYQASLGFAEAKAAQYLKALRGE